MGERTRKAGRRSGWRQWRADEARRVLREWRASGLPLESFARERGLTGERLRWWRNRLSEWKDPGPGETSLAPVVITGVSAPVERSAAVTVRAGELVVEVADVEAVPAAWLSAFMVGLTRPTA